MRRLVSKSLSLASVMAMLCNPLILPPVPLVHADTLTVTNTGNDGAGSLRQAILDAAAGDTIELAHWELP